MSRDEIFSLQNVTAKDVVILVSRKTRVRCFFLFSSVYKNLFSIRTVKLRLNKI